MHKNGNPVNIEEAKKRLKRRKEHLQNKKVGDKGRTYYVYDDTPYPYYHAAKHVQRYLKSHGVDTDIRTYRISNEHPCGVDCICVDVGFEIVGNSYLDWTIESLIEHDKRKWYSNILLSDLLRVDQSRFYVVCDGDSMCIRWGRHK